MIGECEPLVIVPDFMLPSGYVSWCLLKIDISLVVLPVISLVTYEQGSVIFAVDTLVFISSR